MAEISGSALWWGKCNRLKASGAFCKKAERLWLPVSSYLIEHPKGKNLVDTGWHRDMSPEGAFDKAAQIKSLGSLALYRVNQGVLPLGQAIDEQLATLGVAPSDLDLVLLTHLDCGHANGIELVTGAKRILCAADELANVKKNRMARVRYCSQRWEGAGMEPFGWNSNYGPHGKPYDVLGDESVMCVAIPGHADGLFAVKITEEDGQFVLLCSDGGYGERSWKEMVLSGIANDRTDQRVSLEWIRQQSEDPLRVACLANHDAKVELQAIELT